MNDIFEKAINSLAVSNKQNEFEFHRKIYYECLEWIDKDDTFILVITGPRKCGKTFCLDQVSKKYNVELYDFKLNEKDNKGVNYFEDVILPATEGLFLLDEITYLPDYRDYLIRLNKHRIECQNKGIKYTKKVVITGSQSYAIDKIVSIALSASAETIQTSFIDFEEWLLWRNKISKYDECYIPTIEDFKDYMNNSSDFTKIRDNIKYIEDCIAETIVSESKMYTRIEGLVSGRVLDTTTVVNVMYSFLAKLHKKVNRDNFVDYTGAFRSVRVDNDNLKKVLSYNELNKRVHERFERRYKQLNSIDFESLYNSIIFLEQLDLITITKDVYELSNVDLSNKLYSNSYEKNGVEKLLKDCTICVKHPMFYFNMLKDVVPEFLEFDINIDNSVYGSALECLLRGLYSYKQRRNILYSYKYDGGEVDLLDFNEFKAYEFTVSETHKTIHFSKVDNEFECILISGNNKDEYNGYINKYFPECILELSRGNFIKYINKLSW